MVKQHLRVNVQHRQQHLQQPLGKEWGNLCSELQNYLALGPDT